jgi:benzoyl-CoA reductase subunit C
MTDQGLAKARQIYRERSSRARDSRATGKKVMGYLCLYPPIEILTGLEIVAHRMFGDMKEPITKADSYLPTVLCPFLRSVLDMGLKGKYDFLDGVVMAHTCDVGAQIPGIWNNFVKTGYSYFIDTPHTTTGIALKQEEAELQAFKKSVESFSGKQLSDQKLKEAVTAHNRQRLLVRKLYDLRKPDPPLISGSETLQVLVALMSVAVEEGNQLLEEVIEEIQARTNGPVKKSARLLVWGPVIHETPLVEMIEGLDANVVMDDTCVGSRAYFDDVTLTEDPIEGLAYHYLVDIKCPRTFRGGGQGTGDGNSAGDLDNRFGYLVQFARDWQVDGVILQSVRYCDSHGYEIPAIKRYLDEAGLPSIYLEHMNTESGLAPLKTRVQAFLEVIGQ